MTTAGTRLLTADDLLRLHDEGVRGELIGECFPRLCRLDMHTAES